MLKPAAVSLLLFSCFPVRGAEVEGVTPDHAAGHSLKPYDRKADTAPSDSPAAAVKSFARATIPQGFTAKLWANEPLLANPVAFSFDGKGRMYIAETHRYRTSVLDIRHYMFMLEDDLANRNQADWERSIKKNFPGDWQNLGVESEVVRLVEDSNGDGIADKSRVYADGFNSILDGIASGVLARPDGVWLTNIPGVYKLTGEGANGKAEKKEEVFRGFGVRFNYTGHDLHGLIKGPDGRIYFSIGDRGTSVKTKEGTMLELPDEGAIFRCEEDGSRLELVMRGLRNPQEMAFDDYGNLFTVDNDSDQGDRERLVYVVEGGDAGWRVGYQHCPQPAERNPWLAEHMWEPRDPSKNQPYYISSPIANMPDGPGGLVHYPGTGLPDKYKGCFFLACYKGSSLTSQVAVFRPVPDGASFKLEMLESFIPGCQATDVDFGPDSRLYVSFWDEGWERTAQGRIMVVENEEAREAQAAQIVEVQKLLGEGMKQRANSALITLLGHKDQRVRLEAQWNLSARLISAAASGVQDGLHESLLSVIRDPKDRLARLHAIWTFAHALRVLSFAAMKADSEHRMQAPEDPETLALLDDPDPEIRAASILACGGQPAPFAYDLTEIILGKLTDVSPRVRLAAAQALGSGGDASAVKPLLELARREQNKSQEMRHVIAHALSKLCGARKEAWETLRAAAADSDAAVRLTVLLASSSIAAAPAQPAWSKDVLAVISGFVTDADASIVSETARLVHDRKLDVAPGSLSRARDPLTTLRGLNARFRRGGENDAREITNWLLDPESSATVPLKCEALAMLGDWGKPAPRDRVNGLYHPLPLRPYGGAPAQRAFDDLPERFILSHKSITLQVLAAIRSLKAAVWDDFVALTALKQGSDKEVRVLALHVLADLGGPLLADTLEYAIADSESAVRIAAAGLLSKSNPARAAEGLAKALESATPEDQRAAFRELAIINSPEADRIMTGQLSLLAQNKIPASARVELLEAARKREAPAVKEALTKYEAALPKDDPLAKFTPCLEGGDIENGRRLYNEHPVAACKRCHMVNKSGGEAGPVLDGIGTRKDRRYLLESMILPNAQIAESFRMVVCTMNDGTIKAGVIKGETADSLTIQAPGEKPEVLTVAQIKSREPVPSGMLPNLGDLLTLREIRDLVEYAASLKE